ncbi:MAG: tetratricopeptide repeat protein [Methanobacteriota archaeon]|nr:MAG: tetratricopeptide repeat protein [Euryarchaeota archaeon]
MGFIQSLKEAFGLKGEAPAAQPASVPAPAPKQSRSMLNNKTVDSWNNAAVILVRQGRYDEAVKEYDRLLATRPNDAELWAGKAEALRHLGKTADADLCAKKAKELS